MSEKTGQEQAEREKKPDENTPPKTPTIEELLAENEKLKKKNFEVIGEKKTLQEKLDQENAEKERIRKDELKKKEDFKTLLEEANQKIESLQGELSKGKENSLSRSISLEVQKLAGDAKDINDIIEKIDINDENVDLENETVTDLAAQIDKIRETKPYLFNESKSTMTTKLPNMNGVSNQNGNKKPLTTRVAEALIKKQ